MADENGYDAISEVYDYVDLYQARPDVDFYVEEARTSGGPVLELGCGTGRILIPTARAGIDITGIDLSEGMLRVCHRMLQQEPAEVRNRVHLQHGDMRSFSTPRKFQLVTIPFRPFLHLLTVDDQLACLGRIRECLGTGGSLVFDCFNPLLSILTREAPTPLEKDSEVALPDGRLIVRHTRHTRIDLLHQVSYGEMVYEVTDPDGRTEQLKHTFSVRYVFRYELEHLLVRAGYRIREIYSSFDRTPYGDRYPGELIVVAEPA